MSKYVPWWARISAFLAGFLIIFIFMVGMLMMGVITDRLIGLNAYIAFALWVVILGVLLRLFGAGLDIAIAEAKENR